MNKAGEYVLHSLRMVDLEENILKADKNGPFKMLDGMKNYMFCKPIFSFDNIKGGINNGQKFQGQTENEKSGEKGKRG